jgi:hypothetical protein
MADMGEIQTKQRHTAWGCARCIRLSSVRAPRQLMSSTVSHLHTLRAQERPWLTLDPSRCATPSAPRADAAGRPLLVRIAWPHALGVRSAARLTLHGAVRWRGGGLGRVSQACHVAAQYGHTAFVYHLSTRGGADVEALDANGRTPLHWAAYKVRAAATPCSPPEPTQTCALRPSSPPWGPRARMPCG